MTASGNQPKSVLVFTCGEQIGDGLVKLPFLQLIRAKLPEASVTWLAGPGPTVYASVLQPVTGNLIDKVLDNPGIGEGLPELFGRRPLSDRTFDLVIDTQRNLVKAAIIRRINHGCFISPAGNFILSEQKPTSTKEAWSGSLNSRLSRLLDLGLGGRGEPLPLPTPVNPASAPYQALAQELLPDGHRYLVLAPGAGGAEKRWPLENFLSIARTFDGEGLRPVFLLGPEEAFMAAPIKDAVPSAFLPEIERQDDRPDLKGPALAIALAGRAEVGVANDAGPGHMIAASGTPLVSLFGKHDPEKYAPAASQLRILDAKAWGGTDPGLIPVETVETAIRELLS